MAISGAGDGSTVSPEGYIGLAVETDPDEIAQDAFDYLEQNLSGWEMSGDAQLEVLIIEGQAQEQAIERDLASQTTDDIFRAFGTLVGISPEEPSPAMGTTVWTMVDDSGYTVEAGTQLVLTGPEGDEVGFETLDDFEVPISETVSGPIWIEAIEDGAYTSGLAGEARPVDALAFVADIQVQGVTTGGVDGEETDAYMDRLSRRLQLQSTAAVTTQDFEVLAGELPEVGRAVAIDDVDNRQVDLIVTDDQGEPLTAGAKQTVIDYFEQVRTINTEVTVQDATYTTVDIDATVAPVPGYTPEYVKQSAETQMATYLSPANWGAPQARTEGAWSNRMHVYFYDVVAELDRADGVDHVVDMTNPTATIDLNGVAPLTRPGTINVTVQLP